MPHLVHGEFAAAESCIRDQTLLSSHQQEAFSQRLLFIGAESFIYSIL